MYLSIKIHHDRKTICTPHRLKFAENVTETQRLIDIIGTVIVKS